MRWVFDSHAKLRSFLWSFYSNLESAMKLKLCHSALLEIIYAFAWFIITSRDAQRKARYSDRAYPYVCLFVCLFVCFQNVLAAANTQSRTRLMQH